MQKPAGKEERCYVGVGCMYDVSVNKEVLDFVVPFWAVQVKGRCSPEEIIVHFLLRHSRGKAKPIMRDSMSCKFPAKLSSVQNGCSQDETQGRQRCSYWFGGFWNRISCSPSWTQTCSVAKDGLKLLVLLSLLLEYWDYRYVPLNHLYDIEWENSKLCSSNVKAVLYLLLWPSLCPILTHM